MQLYIINRDKQTILSILVPDEYLNVYPWLSPYETRITAIGELTTEQTTIVQSPSTAGIAVWHKLWHCNRPLHFNWLS